MTEENSFSNWVWIEPYVHISIKKNNALLYNTLSGAKIETNQPVITGLLKDMTRKENLRVLEMPIKKLEKPAIRNFIDDIKKSFMGDTALVNLSKGKPVQLIPLPVNYADIKRVKKDPSLPGKSILSYLSELTLFINNYSSHIHGTLKKYTNEPALYKQSLFPYSDTAINRHQLPINKIVTVLDQVKESGLNSIKITGGNIFDYSCFDELLKVLGKYPFRIIFHVHYLDAVKSLKSINDVLNKNMRLALHITFPLEEGKLDTLIRFAGLKSNLTLYLAILDEKDFENATDIVSRFKPVKYRIIPYYNGENPDFFKKMVFFNKEILWAERPSQKEIFRRMALNAHDFGKLSILCNGMIYANLNNPPLGNIDKHSVREMIFKELYHGKSWLRVRPGVKPCKDCLYNLLCPPLSNYEYALGRNNLCNIYP